ncbi:MAG: acyl-CoA reductase [Firmicutes bacterium]|nr:acyl-CoA reductase [Bacillota bacterium]
MILYKGKILENIEQKKIIESLREDCYQTLSSVEPLQNIDVIKACNVLAQKVKNKDFDDLIIPLLQEFDIPYDYFLQHIPMFEEQALLEKIKLELGTINFKLESLNEKNIRSIEPLGILFHIAAGNVDALPAYSVIEGLLAGNINILKLPSGDRGVSVALLSELIQIEPKIKDYIYVFDVPSTETETLQDLANIADAIIVWGGDAAVKAVRSMAPINAKIIEWGHKLSFAYASIDASDEDLIGLAHHIAMTDQMLCSSAQGIFVDTTSRVELDQFASRFFKLFVEANKTHKPVPYGIRSRNAIVLYNEKLEQSHTNKKIWKTDGISVITSDDSELTLSMLYRNVWIKMCPKEHFIQTIKPHKNHIQTASILTTVSQFDGYANLIKKTGIVRITKPSEMSRMVAGEAHDGQYPLRLYTRIVEQYKP